MNQLTLSDPLPLLPLNGGLFVSRGRGIHPQRIIGNYELIFVASGTLHMREDDQRFDLVAGQSLLLWPGREHAGTAPYAPDCSFYWLHFERTSEEAEVSLLQVPQTTTVARPDHLTELFRRFLDDQEARLMPRAVAAHLILLMLYEVALPPSEAASTSRGGAATILARHAYQYVTSHLYEAQLATASVARALDCNPDYLGRCFREEYGYTVTEAIHRQRLQQARSLLLSSNETVEAIARECGFSNVIFFRRLFKRQEGLSPTAYRHLYARAHVNSELG
jgi:AraC-like DNA-binding protein